jgi:uncharacterized protein (TIGR01244 family)
MITTTFRGRRVFCAALLACAAAACTVNGDSGAKAVGGNAEPCGTQLIAVPNARIPVEGVLTGGQPTREQLEFAAETGYLTVINLRPDDEKGALEDEATLVADLGMRYVHLPVGSAKDLTEDNVRLLDSALSEAGPILFHCASGNRVGALLALRAALVYGVRPEEALALGRRAGLSRLEETTRKLLGVSAAP